MKTMSSVKRSSICALCIALCYVLPLGFHAFGAGELFLPIHIPVLLCGMVCGWGYGLFCGIAGPVLSCVLSGMPSPTDLISMVPELSLYGLVTGLLLQAIRTRFTLADLYLALIPAMAAGRIAGGLAKALFYLSHARGYSLGLWVSGYVVKSLPGILLQLAVLPPIVFALMKAGLIPARYPGDP